MKKDNCTAMLVGKDASIDGSTMIARDEDGYGGINEKLFVVNKARHYDEDYVSKYNGFKMHLEGDGCKWTAAPTADDSDGRWDEQGINEYNVAMSATETEATNARCLGHDPLVEDGINEDSMVYITLPFVKTAREGVKRLGRLIEKYGTGESNGIAFSDNKEVWYLETGAGHQWVAARVPDDSYAICPNIMVIQNVDFNDPDNFMYSEGIQEFVEKHHLNPDHEGWNFRHIFGTYTEQDRHYNTNRQWYIQKLFNPEIEQDPQDGDIPFIRKAAKKITKEDIEFALGSHYQDTPYDPFGKGTDEEKHRYRPIGLNRTQNAHILQIRSDVPEDRAAIMWLCIGGPTFTPFIPFFANMNDTDPSFNNTSMDYNMNDAWWYYKSFAAIVESHYPQFVQLDTTYLTELNRYFRGRVEEIIKDSEGKSGDELTEFLTKENQKTVAHTRKETEKLWGQMMIDSINMSKLTFNMDENL